MKETSTLGSLLFSASAPPINTSQIVRFDEYTEGMVEAKAPLCKGSSAEGGEGLLQDKVEIYMGTNANS